ncbi:MAG: tetraacyldisaccharide 4'-kinase [Acidobacteriota bacterium]
MIDFAEAPSVPKSPWQLFYGAMHRLRWHWYARRASRLPVPVVSVGNIHWGGSGKTPLVAAIARRLQDTDRVVSILSRGYGSRAKGVRIVSTGEGPLLGPVVAGDEPVLLAGELPGVSVVVGPNRAAAEDPWAGGRLLPSGRLREPLTSLARADAVVLSEASQSEADLFAKALGRYGFSGPGFASMIRPRRPRLDHDSELPADSKVLLVAAIARPHRLVDSAKELGYRVSDFLTFPDHYPYPEPSLRRIEEKFHQSDARAVVTSSKDMVKLWGRLDIPLAELSIRAEPDSTFFDWLDRRLEQIGKAEKRQ